MRLCILAPSLSLFPFFGFVSSALVDYPAVVLPLRDLFDNQAASTNGSASFDTLGSSFDSQYLPSGPWLFDGIKVVTSL